MEKFKVVVGFMCVLGCIYSTIVWDMRLLGMFVVLGLIINSK
jgi:hypothetical protein